METNVQSLPEIPGVKQVVRGKLRWTLAFNPTYGGHVVTIDYLEEMPNKWWHVASGLNDTAYENMWPYIGKQATYAVERELGFELPDSESMFMELISGFQKVTK